MCPQNVTVFVRKLRVSVQPDIIDRDVPEDRLWAEGWNNVEFTVDEFVQSIRSGRPYCAQVDGHRDSKHFLGCDVASADVDHGPTMEEALQNPLVRDHATILYTTVRHRPDAPRYRIVFVLPRTITDAGEMAALLRAFGLRVSGDPKAIDPAHMFFGNRNAEVRVFDRQLSAAVLDELIAQGLSLPESDGAGNGGVNLPPSRSRLLITENQQIRAANGTNIPFSDIVPRTKVHCPFHHDVHPSAFVLANRNGMKGLHCSTCGCTYWPERPPSGDEALESFGKAVRAAAARFHDHQDDGPLAALFGFDEPSGQPGASTIRIVNGQPTPPVLLPGHVMVRSPKGSGKTTRLKQLLTDAKSVLLIGHRRALIKQTCDRLDLHCYLDDGPEPNVGRYPRYGICLDSLAKIPAKASFDVVVLDESEQVLAHFLAETMDRGGGSRDRIFVELRRLVRKAKTVIAMDADLGWVTFRTLSRLDPRKPKHIWFNEGTPGADKTIHVYQSQPHLVAELKQALTQGKRCFVTSNAKGKVVQLARAMKDDFPAKAFVTITADTAQEKAIKDFISDPSTEALKYDAVFASPSIGTGVDIAFPDQAQVFDAVFGFCEAQITTHLEFDQQLSRVRHPGEVKVWITPRKFNFETEFQVVKRDALERSLFKNLVVDYDDSGEPQYQENDPFLEMASLIVSEQRASKNNLKGNFVRHKEKQGFLIEYVGKDHKAFGEGQALLIKGKSLDDQSYCEAILSAEPLTPPEYDRSWGGCAGRGTLVRFGKMVIRKGHD